MKTIWKFGFTVQDFINITMPDGAKILHVECQHGNPCIWALCWPNAPSTIRHFRVFGTGHNVPGADNSYEHIGTFQWQRSHWELLK